MSLKLAADHLKNQGRGPDTELVHMSKNELKGLQALAMSHGGSLTINPHTGLVEAGFLEKILPSLAGAAVGYFTGMPMLGAAVGGGLGYAQTGNLQSGLMAGLGAYGGASLLGGIEGIGASELVNAAPFDAEASISQLAETDPIGAIAKGGDPTAVSQVYDNGANLPGSQLQSGLKAVQQNPMGFLKGNTMPLAMAAAPLLFSGLNNSGNNQMPVAGKGPANPMGLQQYSNFVAQVPAQPNPYYKPAYPDYQQTPYVAKYADGGDVSSIVPPAGGPVEQLSRDNATGNNQMFPQSNISTEAFSSPTNRPISQDLISPTSDTNVDPYTGAERFAAGGQPKVKDLPMGDVGIYQETDPDLASLESYSAARKKVDKLNAKYQTGLKSGLPTAQPLGAFNLSPVALQQMQQVQQQPQMSEMSSGGLGSYSDGGHLLKGPGDGMSDDIPAKIGQHQPARLADGEFVVPADVVSHLGNGSTEAGAKQLYSMMDKIRKARTGKAKQAPEVKADKFLPK